MEKGRVVKSLAGRDKGGFFVVVQFDGEFCFLADGKLRKLESPKRKKLKHVCVTKTVLDVDCLLGNRRLWVALRGLYGEKICEA
jgi:ribosomal protein L14E/L6E/L27E